MTDRNDSLNEKIWANDFGKPVRLPVIVDTPDGKFDISDWAKDILVYDYWLCFRRGTTEINALFWFSLEELATRFNHGDIWNGYQFIVEKLRS